MKKHGIYLQLISIHGLIRGNSLELGRDADTGGQTKYVVELAKAMASHEDVGQVDLVTRLIHDKNISGDYSKPIEEISRRGPHCAYSVRRSKIPEKRTPLAPP